MEEKTQSSMNSNYAILKEEDQDQQGKSCTKRWWSWWTKKTPPTVAETMSMLQHTRLQLDLNMNHCRQRIAKHEQKMRTYAEDAHMRSAALREFRMIKHYRKRHDRWHAMSANLETVQSEIQAQQQTIAVFGAYTRANEAMGKLAEDVDMSSLCQILDTLRDRMEEGRDMSDAMGSVFNAEADASELEAEFDAFMLSEQKKKSFIQEGGEGLQQQQQHDNNNDVREGEQEKKIFFFVFLSLRAEALGVCGA
jgi:phage shock protein A